MAMVRVFKQSVRLMLTFVICFICTETESIGTDEVIIGSIGTSALNLPEIPIRDHSNFDEFWYDFTQAVRFREEEAVIGMVNFPFTDADTDLQFDPEAEDVDLTCQTPDELRDKFAMVFNQHVDIGLTDELVLDFATLARNADDIVEGINTPSRYSHPSTYMREDEYIVFIEPWKNCSIQEITYEMYKESDKEDRYFNMPTRRRYVFIFSKNNPQGVYRLDRMPYFSRL